MQQKHPEIQLSYLPCKLEPPKRVLNTKSILTAAHPAFIPPVDESFCIFNYVPNVLLADIFSMLHHLDQFKVRLVCVIFKEVIEYLWSTRGGGLNIEIQYSENSIPCPSIPSSLLTYVTSAKILDWNQNQDDLFNFISNCPSLNKLTLAHCRIGEKDTINQLLSLPQVTSLTYLDLYRNTVSDVDMIKIAQGFTNLESLFLGGNNLTLPGVKIVAENFPRLIHVGLSRSTIDKIEVLYNLAVNHRFLRKLLLTDTPLSPANLTTLLGHLPHIRTLLFNRCRLGDEGVQCLANTPGLKSLYLQSNGITSRGAEYFSKSPHMTSLRSLYLTSNTILDSGAQILFSSQYLTRLCKLSLAFNRLSDASISFLHETKMHLRKLWVGGNVHFHSAGAITLANCPTLTSLQALDLSKTGMGMEGIACVLTSPYLTSLVNLEVDSNDELKGKSELIKNLVGQREINLKLN